MLKKTLGATATALALASILSASTQATAVDGFDTTQHSLTAANSPWVVVNKKHPLNPIKYVPANLVTPKQFNGGGLRLAKPAADAFLKLALAGKAAGAGSISIASGYRSYTRQVAVHAEDVRKFGLVAGEKLAARPGFSEHQTGLAIDVWAPSQGCRIRVCFSTTKAGKWLKANAWKYGFIIRYPDGSYPITGYQFEPWHLRFVGVELTTQMHSTGETILERFWNYPASPKY
jgi:D-alanyl-D-alanine carboxypeptidase